MRTTLNLDDEVLLAAKQRAASESSTLTRVIEQALRDYLAPVAAKPYRWEPLVVDAGPHPGADLSDRDRLYDLMDSPG